MQEFSVARNWMVLLRLEVEHEFIVPSDPMQQVSLEQFDLQVILESNLLLLRKDWADWRRWPFLGATEHCHHLLWNVLLFFLLLCFLIVLSPKHWSNGMSDDRIFRSSAAFSPLFLSNIHLVCHRKFRTTPSQIQAPRKTNDRGEIVEHILQHLLNYFRMIHSFPLASHSMSLTCVFTVFSRHFRCGIYSESACIKGRQPAKLAQYARAPHPNSAPEAQSSHRQREGGHIADIFVALVEINLQNVRQTLPQCPVVRFCELGN